MISLQINENGKEFVDSMEGDLVPTTKDYSLI